MFYRIFAECLCIHWGSKYVIILYFFHIALVHKIIGWCSKHDEKKNQIQITYVKWKRQLKRKKISFKECIESVYIAIAYDFIVIVCISEIPWLRH